MSPRQPVEYTETYTAPYTVAAPGTPWPSAGSKPQPIASRPVVGGALNMAEVQIRGTGNFVYWATRYPAGITPAAITLPITAPCAIVGDFAQLDPSTTCWPLDVAYGPIGAAGGITYAPATSVSVSPAAAAFPGGACVAPPTSEPATALGAAAVYPLQLTIFPDPLVDVAIATSAISSYPAPSIGTPVTGVWILRAGGAPVVLAGPVDVSKLFVLANSAAALISYVGQ